MNLKLRTTASGSSNKRWPDIRRQQALRRTYALFTNRKLPLSADCHIRQSHEEFPDYSGIIIGVASVISVVSLTGGMSAFIGDSFEALGSNSLTISSYTPFEDLMKGVRSRLSPEDLELIERRAEALLDHTDTCGKPIKPDQVWAANILQ